MSEHLNDADLVAFALLSDESPELKLHLASCEACSERLATAEAEIERRRKAHHKSVDSRDATFWKRQELAVMREVARTRRPSPARRSLVAAALLAVAMGGFWFGRSSVDQPNPNSIQRVVPIARSTGIEPTPDQQVQVPASAVSSDPWDSDSLEEFQAVVDWETWVDDEGKDQGTI